MEFEEITINVPPVDVTAITSESLQVVIIKTSHHLSLFQMITVTIFAICLIFRSFTSFIARSVTD